MGKNRVHLDLRSASAHDQAALVGRLAGLGARPADIGQGDVPWVMLADPEGNELCMLTPRWRRMGRVTEIDAGELLLRPVGRDVALALLQGPRASRMVLAPGYPSRFSLETMRLVVDAEGDRSRFGPFFMVRKADAAVVGEIGATFDVATGTAQVGYTVVEPSWGRGYATAALRALLARLLPDPRVRRVVAETLGGTRPAAG